uniref:Putative ovule protein n=1 Tax=Solanum chacoense TaxID=4108 RepID=A0A0V0ILZ0_SOLCH
MNRCNDSCVKYVFLSGVCKDTSSSELSCDSGGNTIYYGMWVNGRKRVILSLMPVSRSLKVVVILTLNSEPKFELYRCHLKSSLLLESYPP